MTSAFFPRRSSKYRRHEENETNGFLGAKGLEHYYLAKARVLDKFPDRIEDATLMRSRLAGDHVQEAVREAIRHHDLEQPEQAREYMAFAAQLGE